MDSDTGARPACDDVEPFTEQSAQQLAAAALHLIDALREYTGEAVAMRGGAAEHAPLLARNAALGESIAAFNTCVFDHTGTMLELGTIGVGE